MTRLTSTDSLSPRSRLSASEKLLLVGELWDDLAANPDRIPVSAEQVAELDRRMALYRGNPAGVTTWQAIQDRLRGNRQHSE